MGGEVGGMVFEIRVVRLIVDGPEAPPPDTPEAQSTEPPVPVAARLGRSDDHDRVNPYARSTAPLLRLSRRLARLCSGGPAVRCSVRYPPPCLDAQQYTAHQDPSPQRGFESDLLLKGNS